MSIPRTICLNMIVRNESGVIERCLDSIKSHIDYWVIVDTGSTDDTMERIQNSLDGIPGELHQREWVNFGVNRNQALELAENHCDYIFLIDADMTANILDPDFRRKLEKSGYFVGFDANLVYYNIRLLRSGTNWRYERSTHEYLVNRDSGPQQVEKCPWVTVTHHEDGGSRHDKYERDYGMLLEDIAEDPDDFHAQFYLGQTANGMGNFRESLDWYEKAANNRVLPGNQEAVWFSQYRIGLIREELGYPTETIVSAYLKAYELRPSRAEPLYRLVKLYRSKQQYVRAHLYARRAVEIPLPSADILYMDRAIYQYLLPIEYSICCYRMNLQEDAIRYSNMALDCGVLPEEFVMPLQENQQKMIEARYPALNPPLQRSNRIVLIVPFRNASSYIDDCVESILSQDYANMHVVFIDDHSSDNSIDRIPASDPRVTLVRNQSRQGAMSNRVVTVLEHCDPEDIVLYVDGDDQLASDDAVSFLNDFYNLHDCWVTYGQFITQNGGRGWGRPFPGELEFSQAFTQKRIRFPIHPISHRAGLIHHLSSVDANLEMFRDQNGEWLEFASDVAIAKATFQLSGLERVRFIQRVLYIYTDSQPQSDFVLDSPAQARAGDYISSLPTLKKLETW